MDTNDVGHILAGVIETIEQLKSIVPVEAQPALEEAETNIQEAAVETESPTPDQGGDVWSEDDLKNEKLEGHKFFE